MAYAGVADVQGRIATQILEIGAASQPTRTQVEEWLDQQSLWIDQALRWKYSVPVTDASDLKVLKPICAALVAAQCWQVVGSHGGELPSPSAELRKEALSMLAYDARQGRAMLVLPGTGTSDSGEAAVDQAESTFTDPSADGSIDRHFTMDMDW